MVPPAYMDPCDGGVCPGATYCATDAGVSECVPRKPLGAQCTRDAECVQLVCTADACVPAKPLGAQCTRGAECLGGVCTAGVCVEPQVACP